MNNPERSALNKISGESRGDKISNTAEKLLQSYPEIKAYLDKVSIKPESLTDYDEATIHADQVYVEKMQASMRNSEGLTKIGKITGVEAKHLAEILEYQIYRFINERDWIPFCTAIKTSQFDDIYNGIDLVVEYSNKERFGHMGLGVDVTFSKNLYGKFERIKKEIDSYDGKKHRLAEVKYFNSNKSGISGRLFNMPRVVAALDIGVMEDLARARELPKNHTAKHAVIMEIVNQLETFKRYAEKYKPACAPHFEKSWAFMSVISQQLKSEKTLEMSEYEKNKEIQEAMANGLAMFR